MKKESLNVRDSFLWFVIMCVKLLGCQRELRHGKGTVLRVDVKRVAVGIQIDAVAVLAEIFIFDVTGILRVRGSGSADADAQGGGSCQSAEYFQAWRTSQTVISGSEHSTIISHGR